MSYDERGGCYVADGMGDLETHAGWRVIHVEHFKPGVDRVTIVNTLHSHALMRRVYVRLRF